MNYAKKTFARRTGSSRLEEQRRADRGISYAFFARDELSRLLEGLRDGSYGIDDIRCYCAVKERWCQPPNSKVRIPHVLPPKFGEARAWRIIQNLYPLLEKHAPHLKTGQIKVCRRAIRYMARSARRAEAVILLMYHLKRIPKKKAARFSYSEVQRLSGMGSEATRAALRDLEARGFIKKAERTRAEHWPTWKYGAKYYDGPNLFVRRVEKIEAAERTTTTLNASPPSSGACVLGKIEAISDEIEATSPKIEMTPRKIEEASGKIEEPIILETNYEKPNTKKPTLENPPAADTRSPFKKKDLGSLD